MKYEFLKLIVLAVKVTEDGTGFVPSASYIIELSLIDRYTAFDGEPSDATETIKLIVLLVNVVPSEFVKVTVITPVTAVPFVGVFGVIVPLLLFVPFVTPVILNLLAVTVPVVCVKSVEPSFTLTLIFDGEVNVRKSYSELTIWVCGFAIIVVIGFASLIRDILATIFLVPEVPSPSVKFTGIVIVSVSDNISSTVSLNVIVFVDTVPLNPPLYTTVPIEVNLLVPPSVALTSIVLGDSEPLPTEFALIPCDCKFTLISTLGIAFLDFAKLNLIVDVPSVPSLSLYEIEAVAVDVSPVNDVISIVDVLGVVSFTVTPVTFVILYCPSESVPWLYVSVVFPSNPAIVTSCILLVKLPVEFASIVCA